MSDEAALQALLARVRSERNAATTALMREAGVDTLLLGQPDDIRYVCDYRSLIINETADWMLAVVDDTGQTDIFGAHVREAVERPPAELPAVRAVKPLPAWVPVMAEPETVVRTIAAALGAARRIGYDAVHPELLSALRSRLPGAELVYVGQELLRARR